MKILNMVVMMAALSGPVSAGPAMEQLQREAGEKTAPSPTPSPVGVPVTGRDDAAKLEALAALMARTQESLADIKDCGDFRLGSGGVYGSGLFDRGGIWCSVQHECPQGTCYSKHRLISPEQLEASPFEIVGTKLVYKPGATVEFESAIVSYADLKTAFKRVLAAKPGTCPTRTLQITGSALRQGRAFLALEEHGCEIEVKRCSLGGMAGSAILLQIREAPVGGKPRKTEALLGSLEFDRRMSELEQLGYKVDMVCYAHHFSGTQAVIQYSKP